MQNGLGYEEEVACAVPGHEVLAGLCFLCSNKIGPGHIRHLDYGSVRLARYAADPHARALAEAIMREVVAGALACGHTIREDFPQKMIGMTLAMPPYHASMKIDFDQRKPMEVEAIHGNPVRRAHAAGGAMPLVETLYRQLMFLDARNCAGR
jgi:ketopantoate reductase